MKKTSIQIYLSLILLAITGITGIATAQYCTPTYTNGSTFGVFVMKVQLDSISDSTGAMATPFYNYDSTQHTTLQPLKTYTISVAAGTYNGNNNNITCWIDFNGDGDFTDAGEKIGEFIGIGAGPTTYSTTFTVPCTAVPGNTRLRVRQAINGGAGGGVTNMSPCNNYGFGECQDYKITLISNPLYVASVDAAQPNTLNVVKGSQSQEIIRVNVFTGGCPDTLELTNLYMQSTGTTDTADIVASRMYFTGSSNQYNTNNKFDSTTLASQFAFSGSQLLAQGDNYFWLAYDIKSNAMSNNEVDGVLDSVTVDGINFVANTSNPAGYRIIDSAMTYSSFNLAQNDTTPATKGTYNNELMMVEVIMSNAGGSVPLNSLSFNTSGSTNTADITRARVYYTGTNNFFDTTAAYFGNVTNPSGSFTVNGLAYLNPGSNYFWLTYDVSATATADDSLDAKFEGMDINGSTISNSTATVGFRTITNDYCYPNHPGCGTQFIQGFVLGNISNTSSGCANSSGNAYSKYPANYFYTSLNRGNNYRATAYNSNAIQTFSMWIDYNHNGTFENTEFFSLTKNAQANIAANDTAAATISIPCSAKLGWTKIRIRSRGQGGANGATDACTTFGSGETEEYFINITNQTISYVDDYQASTLDVLKGWTNQQIIKIAVVANSCSGAVALTKLNLSTNGSTDTADIKTAKVYYTGATNTFNTNTLLGSVTKPGANFSVTCNQSLVTDTNWIWVVYDIDTNATLGNYVDAELLNLVIGGSTYAAATQAPAGSRLISNYMTLTNAVASHPTTAIVYTGSTNQIILRVNFNMSSGAATSLSKIYLNTKGTTTPTTTISNAMVWTTGADASFTNPVQFGTAVAAPSGSFNMTGSYSLNPGDNYFWLTYNVQANALANDSVDATLDSMVINNTTLTPGNGAPNGFRLVAKTYCNAAHTQSCNQNPSYIHGVKLNTINNWKSGCTSITANKYNVYTTSQFTTTLYRGTSHYLTILNDTNSVAQAFGFWADFNQNGTFETTEFYQVSANMAINTKDSVSFQIPCTAKTGLTRLRVRSRVFGGAFGSTDACTTFGSGETEDYIINIQDNPNAGWLGGTKISCNGASVTLSAGVNFSSYKWSTGDTTATITVNTPGKYYLTATTISGCKGTDTTDIVASNVSVSLGNDTAVCNGGSVTIDAGAGYSSYLWSTGDTTQSANLTNAGSYTVTVTNADKCAATDTIDVNWNYASVALGNDTTICVGSSVTLDAGAHSTYQWSNGANTQTISVNATGVYHVYVTDAGGCTGYDTVSITVSAPSVSLGNDVVECAGVSVTLDPGTWSAYSWSNGANTQTINPTVSGQYIVNVVNTFGCVTSDTIDVTFNALPTVNLGRDTILCLGNTLNLDGGAGSSWAWNTGASTQTISVTLAGTYGVRTTNAAGCTASDSVVVTNSSAAVSAGPDKTFCEGKSDTLFATTGYPSYQWSTGSTSWFILPTISGNYWVKVTNIYGCTATDTAIVNVLPKTKATFTTQYLGNQITFVPDDTTGATYLWDFGDGSLSSKKQPSYTYQTFGNYTVSLKVTGKNGCEDFYTSVVKFNAISSIGENPFSLGAYPNPFNDDLTLSYTLSTPAVMTINIMDATGREVMNLGSNRNLQGSGTTLLSMNALTQGVYFVKVTVDGQAYTLRVIKTDK